MKKEFISSDSRGKADYGWLHTHYSFSFSNYHNPKRMGYGALRVLNDDVVDAAKGFPLHPHENMEIITLVLSGALEHKDSMGSGSVIKAGEMQVMSAGSGITHSEGNASKTEKVELFQIWIETKEEDIEPRYEDGKALPGKNAFSVVASGKKGKGLYIHQDASLSLAKLEKGKKADYALISGHGAYVFVIDGKVSVCDETLEKRDALAVSDTKKLEVKALEDSFVLLIDVPL